MDDHHPRLNVIVAEVPPALMRQLLASAGSQPGVTVEVIDDAATVCGRDRTKPAILVAGYQAIERLNRADPTAARKLQQTVPLIVAFSWDKALCLDRLAAVATSWLLVDDLPRFGVAALELGRCGLWILPELEKHRHPGERLQALLLAQLTPSEKEVLAELGLGKQDSAIAARLALSKNRVRSLLRSALRKLNTPSRVQAACFACACRHSGLL